MPFLRVNLHFIEKEVVKMKNSILRSDYVFKMPDKEFEKSLHIVARSDEFSAVASGMGSEATFATLREKFSRYAVPAEMLEDDESLEWLVMAIARRLMR